MTRKHLREIAVRKIDAGEYDYEGDMTKNQLRTIIRNARMMHNMLRESDNLPEWVQGKITLAEDYLISAANYLQSTMQESHYPTQGSSVEYPKYKQMDMDNLGQDAIRDMPEDDGPHTSKIGDPINYTTVDHPEKYINQSSSKGNRENMMSPSTRLSGKPFKKLKRKPRQSYGSEDFSGAVAGVAVGQQ
jgi:hypothetical protein